MKRASILFASVATLVSVEPARADPGAAPPAFYAVAGTPVRLEAPPPQAAPPYPEISISAGLRGMLLPSIGFDPYAGNDFLGQLSIAGAIAVVRTRHASILLFGEWDVGTRSGTARGQDTSLTLHRLGGGAETRLLLARRFYLSAKLAPAALHLRGTLRDSDMDRPLVSRNWTWGLDTTGGVGVLLGGARVQAWITLDLGYMFAGERGMTYAPGSDEEDTRRFGAVTLPSIKPSGAVSRLALAVTF